MSHFKNVNVVSHYVTDWERAKKFYDDVLGWPVAWSDDEFGWREYGRDNETHLAINRVGPQDSDIKVGVRGPATAVLTVENCQEVTAELRRKGVKCDDVVTIPGVVTYGTFYDPDGNRIQMVQPEPPAA